MALVSDTWFIRLPDGRVVLAKSTRAVRYHLGTGRIPASCRVRRSAGEEWQKLDGIPEFAHFVSQPPSRDLPAPMVRDEEAPGKGGEFQTLGMGGLVNELLNAADSSLNRYKLWIAGLTSLAWGVGFLALGLLPRICQGATLLLAQLVTILILLFAAGLATSILGQMTLVEMSRLRPARFEEVRHGLFGKALKIMVGQGLILGLVLVPLLILQRFPDTWTRLISTEPPPQVLQGALLALRLALQVLFWPLAGMTLLLGPLFLVEECSLLNGLAQWWDLLKSDLSRIFLYETLAGALGTILTFPLIFPVVYAAWTFGTFGPDFLSAVALATLHVLGGLAATPLVAFQLVANVFIYLNLRYEFLFPNQR